MLEVPDLVRCVLLCILEAANGVSCALEVPNFVCHTSLYTGGRGWWIPSLMVRNVPIRDFP